LPTYVTCPTCIQNLPRKYKKKKEKKETFDPICNACPYKDARKSYEEGIKKHLWLKRYSKAIKEFDKAISKFEKAGGEREARNVELTSLMTEFKDNQSKDAAVRLINSFVSEKFKDFRDPDYVIPEFEPFLPLYKESIAWAIYSNINAKVSFQDKLMTMKRAAKAFFDIGYKYLFFGPALTEKHVLNTEMALELEARSEEMLGDHYAGMGEVDQASVYYQNAIVSYTNLEMTRKARELRNLRKALRMERACWVCGTRSKGYTKTFDFIYTHASTATVNYYNDILKQRQERIPHMHSDTLYSTEEPIAVVQETDIPYARDLNGKTIMDRAGAGSGLYLAVCKGCRSILDEMSDITAEKKVIPIRKRLDKVERDIQQIFADLQSIHSAIAAMRQEISRLGSLSHTHSSY
jgi:tetratricopeptide (TPR) repeat protein